MKRIVIDHLDLLLRPLLTSKNIILCNGRENHQKGCMVGLGRMDQLKVKNRII